ncbi:MAG: DUF5003 domain-containing protein [Bacteroides sp.]|nr:DUF5003 domain-containing protein [Bacteroides sp.]
MKILKKYLLVGAIGIMPFCISACSDNDDDSVVPIFPSVETMNVAANSEQTFNFVSNMAWRMSSSATWCTFPEVGEKAQNISGEAGSHTVRLKISDESMKFDKETKAVLTLIMDGQKQVVAEIVRGAKEYEFKVFDAEGNETDVLNIGHKGSLEFSVEANFEFAATSSPEWLDEVVMKTSPDNPGKKHTTVTVKEEYVKNSQHNASLVFGNEEGTVAFPVPVSYAGMDPTKIYIESEDLVNGSFFNWMVSMDGKTFTKKNELTNETEEIKDKMTFRITAANDEYTPVFMEEYNGEFYFDDVEWMHLVQNGETATFTVDASDRERKGFVLVFPNAVYHSFNGDLKGNILEADGSIKYEYEQKNFLVAFSQKNATAGGGFFIRNGLTWDEIENVKVTDPSILEYVMGNCMYYGEDIYSVNVKPNTSLIIYPQLPESVWQCEMSAMIMGDEYALIESITLDLFFDDTGHCLQFKVPEAATKPIYVVIKDNSWQFLKVLVVIPNK